MKTLVLITTLLLVLQAQAEPLLGAAEEAPEQMQSLEEDQAMCTPLEGLKALVFNKQVYQVTRVLLPRLLCSSSTCERHLFNITRNAPTMLPMSVKN